MVEQNAEKISVSDTPEYLDTVCEGILEGMPLGDIASRLGRSKSGLLGWIAARPERTARVRSARAAAAVFWDEEAERVIREAECNAVEMQRARELAQHLRWRASKVAPADYGDKLRVEGKVDIAERLLQLERKGLMPQVSDDPSS